MDLPPRAVGTALRLTAALPRPVRRLIAGRPVRIDGLTLDVDTQAMLRMQRLTRMPVLEQQPVPGGRRVLRHQTAALALRRTPVAAVRDLRVAGADGDLDARLYTPTEPGGGADGVPLLVFFHGGGFVYGDLETHDGPCRLLAERGRVLVLAVDYRLAPEAPFPAAVDDAWAAFRWAVEHAAELGVDPARIAVGGDSAGGNLAAVTAIRAAREGVPLAWQLLVYPATDQVRETRSAELFGRDLYLTSEFMDRVDRCYLSSPDERTDWRASPARAELPAGLAPAFVATAGFDPLRDEGEAYADLLRAAGVDVELRRFDDQIHGFLNMVDAGRRSRVAVVEVASRVRAALA